MVKVKLEQQNYWEEPGKKCILIGLDFIQSRLMRKILLAIFLSFYIIAVQADFDFDTYQPITFAEIKARHTDDLLKASQKSGYVISADTFKYRISATFSNELRKITNDNRTVIKAWQKALRVQTDFVERYQHEFKAVFGKETYWIPVQESLLPHMGSELHPGDKFELYVIVIGAINNKLVFLTTEFRSDRAPL